ncbi:hypothetical protein [Amorphus sp. 3PC139-8]|uniref:hypothetical protein n=1 Tax=Amorphus sp. 3PC139-8 TaxID=2735676 RepID=UPI00345D8CA2
MPYVMPPAGSIRRAAFDDADFVTKMRGQRPLPTLRGALSEAKRTFAGASRGDVGRVWSIVLEATDRVSLISVGPRGGWRREWTFGYGLAGNCTVPTDWEDGGDAGGAGCLGG